jgi:hypothetical protein
MGVSQAGNQFLLCLLGIDRAGLCRFHLPLPIFASSLSMGNNLRFACMFPGSLICSVDDRVTLDTAASFTA